MKKLFTILLFLISVQVFGQTYTAPVSPVAVPQVTWYRNAQGMWGYRGSSLGWWLYADSLMVKRMITAASGGSAILNQFSAPQASANAWIDGTFKAGTATDGYSSISNNSIYHQDASGNYGIFNQTGVSFHNGSDWQLNVNGSGASITGITAFTNELKSSFTPVNPTDVANKSYVDAHAGSGTVTSITPGTGFVSHTPITSSGTMNIDTAAIVQNVVHKALAETITGQKTFNQGVVIKNQASTPPTPAGGFTTEYFDNLSRKAYINSAGYTRTYRIQYPGNVLTQFPYLSSSILADSTQTSTALNTQTDNLTTFLNRQYLMAFYNNLYNFYTTPATTLIATCIWGDSVAPHVSSAVTRSLQEKYGIGAIFFPGNGYAGYGTVGLTGTIIYNGVDGRIPSPGNFDGAGGFTDFTYLPSGKNIVLGNAATFTYDNFINTGYVKASVIFATGPSDGSASVQLINNNTAAVITTTPITLTNGTVGATAVDFTGLDPTIPYKIKVTSTTRVNILLAGLFKAGGLYNIDYSCGGSSLSQNDYSNKTILAYINNKLNPTLLMQESKAEDATTIPPFVTLLNTYFPPNKTSVFMIGSLPDVAGSSPVSNAAFKAASIANGYAYVDGTQSIGGGYAAMNTLWPFDGTHPLDQANTFVAYTQIMPFLTPYPNTLEKRVIDQRATTNGALLNSVDVISADGYTDIPAIVNATGGAPTKVNFLNSAGYYFGAFGTPSMYLNGANNFRFGIQGSTDGSLQAAAISGTTLNGSTSVVSPQGYFAQFTAINNIVIRSQGGAGAAYNFNLPATVGTSGQAMLSQGGVSASMTWASVPLIQASANLTAQTSTGNITTFTVGASTATFNISAYVNVTAVATDVIQAQVTYTDENNTAQTVSFTTVSTVTNSTYSPITIRAKNATVITLKTNLTVGAGTITFDAGGAIIQN